MTKVFIKSINTDFIDGFDHLYGSFGKIFLSVNPKKSKSGIQYDVKLKINYPGLNNTNFSDLDALIKNRFIIRVVLENNDMYQIGEDVIPLNLKYNLKTPKGFTLTFFVQTIFSPIFLGKFSGNANYFGGFPYELAAKL